MSTVVHRCNARFILCGQEQYTLLHTEVMHILVWQLWLFYLADKTFAYELYIFELYTCHTEFFLCGVSIKLPFLRMLFFQLNFLVARLTFRIMVMVLRLKT